MSDLTTTLGDVARGYQDGVKGILLGVPAEVAAIFSGIFISLIIKQLDDSRKKRNKVRLICTKGRNKKES